MQKDSEIIGISVYTWSTDRMTQVASEAAVMALTLTRAGSRTHASKLSVIPSDLMSTPKLDPLAAASSPLPTAPACFCRSLLKMLLASKPALSQRVLSIIMIVGCLLYTVFIYTVVPGFSALCPSP